MPCYVQQLGPADLPWAFAATWDYSPAMIAAIKKHVPSRARAWQPGKRRWVFKAAQLDTVLALADIHCGGCVAMQTHAPQFPSDTGDNDESGLDSRAGLGAMAYHRPLWQDVVGG